MVLGDVCPLSMARSVYEGNGNPESVWATMVDLGWPGLAIEEEHDGLGLGFVESVLVAEEIGRAVAPAPFLSTTTQFVPAIRDLGQNGAGAHLLSAVATGSMTGALALSESGRWDGEVIRTSARRDGRQWIVNGEKSGVLDGATADEVVIIARGDAGLGAFVVPRSELTVTQRVELDPTFPLADLRLDAVTIGPERVLAEPGESHVPLALAKTVEQATGAVAAMTTGACRRIVEITIEYAKVREQYGRPIGSFQALKHRLVEMYLAVERATALVYYAALTVEEDTPERGAAVAAAKAAAGDCQRLVAEDGLQLHGGIGYTWENDLHFLLKRAKAGDAHFGNAIAQRARLARILGLIPQTRRVV